MSHGTLRNKQTGQELTGSVEDRLSSTNFVVFTPDGSSTGASFRKDEWDFTVDAGPWAQAKVGEIWVLETSNHEQGPYRVEIDPTGQTLLMEVGGFTGYFADSDRILSGRRIWPEVTA